MPTTTLPTFSKTIDNDFTQTWYDIRPDAVDNILNSTVLTAALKMRGCFKEQNGGRTIERTVRYGAGPTPTAVGKGDLLPTGEFQTRTSAFWNFERAIATHIQRSLFDDVANAGQFQISNYIKDRTQEAMDVLKQKYEGDLLRAAVTDESGKEVQGLCDMIRPAATRTTGTYGGIALPSNYTSDVPDTGNVWWAPRYYTLNSPVDVNLVVDMNHFFNVVNNQQEPPNLLVTSQALYEVYTNYGLDNTQFVGNQKLLDLGFDTLKFRGADMIYCAAMAPSATLFDGTTAGYAALTYAMLFLNTNWIECVYEPKMWFEMTPWKDIYNQAERIAHILCRFTMVSRQLRRHGLLYQ